MGAIKGPLQLHLETKSVFTLLSLLPDGERYYLEQKIDNYNKLIPNRLENERYCSEIKGEIVGLLYFLAKKE